jgi:hypothetical protein
MATLYKIQIKTVSPFVAYDEHYIREMFDKFIRNYKDHNNGMGFEATEIEVEVL